MTMQKDQLRAQLMDKANRKGFITYDDILTALPDVERDVVAFQGIAVHPRLVAPLTELVEEARSAGFDLRVASGFRSIDRQCQIWNAKAAGLRPVLDDAGEPLSIDELTPMSLVFAILRWSALPAALWWNSPADR